MKHGLISLLRNWFDRHARPALAATETPEQLADYDQQAAALDAQAERVGELFPICVLGQAGVGKSTLINALIAETGHVVPSGGGNGPLTANALRVRYGEEKRFTVLYHGKQFINHTRFALDRKLERELQARGEALPVSDPGENSGTAEASGAHDVGGEEGTASDSAVHRARLWVAGSQHNERSLSYLVDALAWVQGAKIRYGSQFEASDLERLQMLQRAMGFGDSETPCTFAAHESADFHVQLDYHASGFLAPLIRDMQIEWPSPMLQNGIELIDLPGIGIQDDLYEVETERFVRERAKGILLVTHSRGLGRDEAELLRKSGFLNRLLHASDDPTADPLAFMVAMVKVDDVAKQNWKNEKEKNGGTAVRKKAEHFYELVESLRKNTATQIRQYFTEVWQSADMSLQNDKNAIIERLCDSVQVFPLSAPQYCLLMGQEDEDEMPFLPDVESTQVPGLRDAIIAAAQSARAEREARLAAAAGGFFGRLRARLNLHSAQLSEESRAQHEREEMEQKLDAYMGPRQREFDTRRGEFRGYLRKTVPELIDAKVTGAAMVAQKEMAAFLSKLRTDIHWATLRAAIRRNGAYFGARRVQIPHDFSLCFEAPVAQVWSGAILQGIRKETANYSAYQEEVLKEVLTWAKTSGIKVTTKLLEALVDEVQQQRKRLNGVGQEAVDELRTKVRSELIRKVEVAIRRRCERFVAERKDIGPGVLYRMQQMLQELVPDVIEAAKDPSVELLTSRFKEVEREIVAAFKEHSNPLEEAKDALLQRYDRQLARQNAKDTQALPVITAAIEAIPSELTTVERIEAGQSEQAAEEATVA